MSKLTPTILWAQRSDKVFVTLDVQDCAAPDVKLANDESADMGVLNFSGTTGDGKEYELKLELHTAIDVEQCKVANRPRKIELVIFKTKTEDNWWPFLTKQKTKDRHIKADWDKWVDEDEEDEADKDGGFDMSQFAGMGGPGAPGGPGGMGGIPGMGGMDGMDMEALMAQMGGAGGVAGEEGEDSDDEDLPDLEPTV